jgi:hypothetical protein
VTPALVALALVVVGGGVVAVSAREPRFATLGALVVLCGAPYVADPLPDPVALAARLTGAVLAGYLVWISLRHPAGPTSGWQIGWPGAAAVGGVAFLAGWLAAGSLGAVLAASAGEGPRAGAATALTAGELVPRAGIAAAAALVALATAPIVMARDALRLGLGLLLLLSASDLARHAFAATTDSIVELGMAVFVAAGGAAIAALVAASIRIHGDLQLRTGIGRPPAVHHRAADEAHPWLPREDHAR